MEKIFALIGLAATAVLILILVVKLDDHWSDQRGNVIASVRVYQAARIFAEGANEDEVRDLLLNCIDFYEEDVDDVFQASLPHRNDRDGGYEAFLKAASKVMISY